MQTEIIIAGFGGQGVLFAGLLLAEAAMNEGKYVTWIPSYGPEMRGGTANVTVVISDTAIGSPLVHHPQAVIALNTPSLEKYTPLLRSGGVLIYNESLLTGEFRPSRLDIQAIPVPATRIATELGQLKMANMVAVGALVTAVDVLPLRALIEALPAQLGEEKQHYLAPNIAALKAGAALLRERVA